MAPVSSLPSIYANARAVLAVTMDEQRDFGMLNNRVFEVLSAGAPMISESFEALEKEFAGIVHQFDEVDLDRTLEEALLRVFGMTDEERDKVGRTGRAVVMEKVRRKHGANVI